MSSPSMEQMFPTPNHLLIPNNRRISMTGKAKVTNSMTGKAKVGYDLDALLYETCCSLR